VALETTPSGTNSHKIFQDVTAILKDMMSDWEGAFDSEIEPSTRLIADLGFKSIDVVEFIVALEVHFGRRDLPVAKLVMPEGRYVEDLNVGQVVHFLASHL
jgi:acyl carrier protein